MLKLLSNWKISLEITGQAEADEELMMVLSQAYLEWEQQTEQRGEQKGLQRERSLILPLLTRRVGSLTPETRSQVESLTLDQLESLGEALLDFSSATDLEDWLRILGRSCSSKTAEEGVE
jgi:predicted transposase YdaD